MRGCIQSILANIELLKLRKVQTLDHKTIIFLNKIEGNCAKLEALLNDCLGSCMNDVNWDVSLAEKHSSKK